MGRIDDIFDEIDRTDFLPASKRLFASVDSPVPIGYGQTNSQPYTVKNMLQWLDVSYGDKVLDVGSGSGWTAALLSKLVGVKGQVYAVEIIPELVEFGRKNCEKYGINNVKFIQAEKGMLGLPDEAPFNRILVSASATDLPNGLVSQLKPGGKMVIPVGNEILEITKGRNKKNTLINHPGFIFVPLVQD
jgi:protein-L-isoaspartate(D-aspartate) O-methyltransferase